MTKQAKTTAREVAAPKKVEVRQVFKDIAAQIEGAYQSLSDICYQAAMTARKEEATAEELELIKSVVSRQKWSDINKLILCAHKLPASAPKNLVGLANYIRALDKGATAAMAKKYAGGKMGAQELKQEIAKKNGEPMPEPAKAAPKSKGAQKRNDDVNGWELLKQAMAAFEKQYSGNEEVSELFTDFYDALKHATAEDDGVDIDEDDAA